MSSAPDLARSARLAVYLDAVSQRPLVWGEDDCLTGFAAPWIAQERGVDPAFGRRGRHVGQMACLLLVHRHGGLLALMDSTLAAIGVERTATPGLGDVGVVEMLTEDGRMPLAAICGGSDTWAVRAQGGLRFVKAAPLAAWEI